MAESLVYRSAAIYELVMLLLYGRHYRARTRVIADMIPPGVSVLDVCCGPGRLYFRHLRHQSVSYTGIDINPRFVARLRQAHAQAEQRDMLEDRPLPPADYVLMQASLYHFLPDPKPVLDRMLRAAKRQVIIAEPIRNLSDSNLPWIAALARRQTNPGSGRHADRFSEQSLDAFFLSYTQQVERSFLLPGGREKVYVLNAENSRRPGDQARSASPPTDRRIV